MSRCTCNCDPCRCRQKKQCVPCTTSETTTIPTCDAVNQCVRDDLQKTLANFGEPAIDNICAVSRKCVNDGFYNVIQGSSSGMDNFTGAVFAALKTLPGYSTSGIQKLTSVNGQIQWLGDNSSTTTSTTTTINPSASTTTTLVIDTVYFGAKVSGTTPTNIEILSGSTVNTDAANNVQINWNSFNASPQYLWFAIPARTINHNKDYYYFNDISKGFIGGGANLFGSPVIMSLNSISHYVWITNYATQTTEVGILSKT